MLFNSWEFVAFFAAVISISLCLPRHGTLWKLFIVGASCYFYGQWNWKYLGLIALTATIDFAIARRFVTSVRPAVLIAISVTCNLGVLAIFKYANFAIASINSVGAQMSAPLTLTPLDLVLPVGISFYTFQNMSYTLDVYRGELQARKSVLDYALFTTFFPQLLAGPIVRASEFFSQLDHPEPVSAQEVRYAIVLIALGYVKKVVFADNLAVHADAVFLSPAGAGAWQTLLSIYAFAFQIYFDFSGYTDIAIGLALLLGLRFPKNFDYPYAAASFQEFWRRWHMTLSRWLRDYLYISLGGNRYGPGRTMSNLMITMVLGGLWHGASWTFVIWGGLHGLFLAAERLVFSQWRWWRSTHWVLRLARTLIVFHLVCVAWVFFRAPDLSAARIMFANLLLPYRAADFSAAAPLASLVFALFAAQIAVAGRDLKARISEAGGMPVGLLVACCGLLLIWFTPGKSVPFIYFQF